MRGHINIEDIRATSSNENKKSNINTSQAYRNLYRRRTIVLSAPGTVNLWGIPFLPVVCVRPPRRNPKPLLRRRLRIALTVVALVWFPHFDTVGVAVENVHHRLSGWTTSWSTSGLACDSSTPRSPTTRSRARIWVVKHPVDFRAGNSPTPRNPTNRSRTTNGVQEKSEGIHDGWNRAVPRAHTPRVRAQSHRVRCIDPIIRR